ncbi:hypothetical protein F0562_025465 [Nyssa sinensis]|uniref:Uncharacterized protein n=1 Tax=Nyssa sinensis TaxID=561372 RepID=A0A5J5B694_9ASTE|nr:hypothetical protein F0562_025465 [Nyssa sinensis]
MTNLRKLKVLKVKKILQEGLAARTKAAYALAQFFASAEDSKQEKLMKAYSDINASVLNNIDIPTKELNLNDPSVEEKKELEDLPIHPSIIWPFEDENPPPTDE